MANQPSVVAAMDAARQRWEHVAPAVAALKRYHGVTDAQIGAALGLSRQTVQNRLTGATALAYWELVGFAALFEVPPEVLLLGPEASIRYVLDHPSPSRADVKAGRPPAGPATHSYRYFNAPGDRILVGAVA